jgi:DNA-binding transcriptional LysR family regulator
MEGMRSLFHATDFSAETARGRVAIASTEYLELTILSNAFMKMRKNSPDLQFQFRNASGRLPKIAMERGEIDIAIAGFFGNLPEGFYQQKIFENDFICVARKNHSVLKSELTLDIYTKLEHLLISPQGDLWGLIDDRLQQQKKSRRVVAGCENYLTPGWWVANSDLVVTVPRYLGDFYKQNLPVNLFELPLPSPKITIVQAWHERTHANPLHQYVRAHIAESSKGFQAS